MLDHQLSLLEGHGLQTAELGEYKSYFIKTGEIYYLAVFYKYIFFLERTLHE